MDRIKTKFVTVDHIKGALIPVLSVLFALLLGTVIILIANRDPAASYAALLRGAFGDTAAWGDTLARATPIIFTGLAVAFAFRCGLFNIGVEGQLLMGALAAAVAGHYLTGYPAVLHLPIAVFSAAVIGGLWASVPGILKAWRGVHEVITTIMMNYIAYSLTAYSIEALRAGVVPKTPAILESARMPRFSEIIPSLSGSYLNWGFVMALAACAVIYFILWKTVLGYEVRAVGYNPLAAEDGGIGVKRNIVLAMVISGALAGLGGAERVLGVHRAFISGLSPGYGFEGIAVALLANNNPFGIILSGLLFGALASGGLYMDMSADVPSDIVVIIQALIIFFVAANQMIKYVIYRRRKEESLS